MIFSRFTLFAALSSVFFLFLISIMLWRGDQTFPSVLSVKMTPTREQIFIDFNRPMDEKSVEKNISFTPPQTPKLSWSGRKLALTFSEKIPSDTDFRVHISMATDRYGKPFKEPFSFLFPVRPQQIIFLGSSGEEERRLVRFNIIDGKKEILTPPDIQVLNFRIHLQGELIFFLGIPKSAETTGKNPLEIQNLYRFNLTTRENTIISSSTEFTTNVFALSPDGKILAAERSNSSEKNGYERSLWLYDISSQTWKKFWKENFGFDEIFFTPDSQAILSISGEASAYALFPLTPDGGDSEILGNFGTSYGFSPDGNMILFRQNGVVSEEKGATDIFDFRRYFVFFRAGGKTENIFSGMGYVTNPVFSPDGKILYFLLQKTLQENTDLITANTFQIYAYDLVQGDLKQLTTDINFSVEHLQISADGKKLLFERFLASDEDVFQPDRRFLSDELGDSFSGAQIWIKDTQTGAETLLLENAREPAWLP